MADRKISELNNITGSSVADTDEFVVVDTSADETKAITASELRTAVGNGDFTVTGNLTVQGTTITIDSASAQTVDLGDNDKIRLGDGDDLQIYHSGTHSFIQDNGTGNLYIDGTNLTIRDTDTAKVAISVQNNSDAPLVQLRYDNSTKLTTTSYGTLFTGNSKWGDNGKATFGDGDDLQIYHDGSNSYIYDAGTGSLTIQTNGAKIGLAKASPFEWMLEANVDGGVALSHAGSVRIETTSVGALIKGNAGSTSVSFGYNEDGGEISLHDETGNVATLLDQAVNNTRLLELQNGSNMLLGLGSSNTTGNVKIMGAGYAESIVVNSSGNVGIGTSSPTAPLDVIVGTDERILFTERGTSEVVIDAVNAANSAYNGLVLNGSAVIAQTNATERMRVDSSGNLLVGTSSYNSSNVGILNSANGRLYATVDGNTPLNLNRKTSVGEIARFQKDSTTVGSVSVTSSATSYNTSSDHRLKENVEALSGAITRVKQLQPKRFSWIADDADSATVDGFLAHEAQTVVPEAVTGTHNEVDADGDPIYQGIDHSKLVPLLTAALQEAITKIEDLESRIAALET